jgi:hypothetical protein
MPTTSFEIESDHSEWKLEDGASYYQYTGSIDNSPPGNEKVAIEGNEREYRLIVLSNGLQVMLVHDPKCDQAAASLCVGVGYLDDPVSAKHLSISYNSYE